MSSETVARPVVDLNRLIDDGRWGGFQRFVFVSILLVFLIEGLDNQVMGTVLPALALEWKLPLHAFAPALAAGWAGAGIGAIAGGYVGDRFGRKPALIGSLLLFGAPTLATIFAADPTTLTILRLLAGLGLGSCDPAALTLLTEFTPRRRQGRAIAFALVISLVGIGLCGLLAAYFLPSYGWRSVFLIVGSTPIAWAVALAFLLEETPAHLARSPGRRPALDRVLKRIGHEVPAGAQIAVPEPPRNGPVAALVSSPLLRSTLCLWAGFFFTYCATGTLFSWAPTLMAQAGVHLAGAGQATFVQSMGGIVGTIAAGLLTERLGGAGSARIFAMGAVGGAALMTLLASTSLSGGWVLLGLLGLEGGLLSGTMTSLFGAAAQIYPSGSRATGIGVAGALGRAGAICSSFIGVSALELAGGKGLFVVLMAASALCVGAMSLIRRQDGVPAT